MLRKLLGEPLLKNLDLDDPAATRVRRKIVKGKTFLRKIYEEWYGIIAAALPQDGGAVLELGAGEGFMPECIPGLISSEVIFQSEIDLVLDGSSLPFMNGSLGGIVMTDVLHHIPNVRQFFSEAGRCVKPGGVVVMIEPWVSGWSTFIYTLFHHEPFDPNVKKWEMLPGGPRSNANDALPWVIFVRDHDQFEREFPEWQIERVKPFLPFRYLICGGVMIRTLTPDWSYGAWDWIEKQMAPIMKNWGMFAQYILRRR